MEVPIWSAESQENGHAPIPLAVRCSGVERRLIASSNLSISTGTGLAWCESCSRVRAREMRAAFCERQNCVCVYACPYPNLAKLCNFRVRCLQQVPTEFCLPQSGLTLSPNHGSCGHYYVPTYHIYEVLHFFRMLLRSGERFYVHDGKCNMHATVGSSKVN